MKSKLFNILMLGSALAVLYIAGSYSYLLFHGFAEIFSVIVACSMFVFVWNARHFIDNNYFIFIGIAYLYVSFLEIFHIFSYEGMGVFNTGGANLTTQLWISARYLQSLSLFSASLLIGKKLNFKFIFGVFSLVTLVLLASIFYWHIFPVCYIPGAGLTFFKIISEYVICLALLFSAILLYMNRVCFEENIFKLIVASIVITVLAELCYTYYIGTFDFVNKLGHLLMIIAFYLMYKATVETGLKKPYNLMFRDLKYSEEVLKEAYRQYNMILESLGDAIYVVDKSSRIVYINSVLRQFNKEINARPDVIGKTPFEVYPFLNSSAYNDYRNVFNNKETIVTEEKQVIKGREYFTETRKIPVIDRNTATSVITVVRDVTKYKEAEKYLKQMNDELEIKVAERTAELIQINKQLNKEIKERTEVSELLEKVFSMTHFLIAYMDKDLNFIRVNSAYAQYRGHEPGYYIGKKYFEVFPGEKDLGVFLKVLNTGKVYTVSSKPISNQKEVRYWDWTLHPVKDSGDKTEGLVLVMADVTENRRAKEELMRVQQDLENAKRLSDIGALSTTVAHELRNPLAVIKMAAFNIKRKNKTGDVAAHVENIEKKIDESSRIIDNLLFYSRIRVPLYEKVNVYALLKDCVELTKVKFSHYSVVFNENYETADGCIVDADPLQMHELFINILNNACESLKEKKGIVAVEGGCARGVFNIDIKDNGIGIDEDNIKRVFDPFFTMKSKGTGLGLAVCQRIVNLHGGRISMESRIGEGTTVHVSIPLERKKYENKHSYN